MPIKLVYKYFPVAYLLEYSTTKFQYVSVGSCNLKEDKFFMSKRCKKANCSFLNLGLFKSIYFLSQIRFP